MIARLRPPAGVVLFGIALLAARHLAARGWGLRPGDAARRLPGDHVLPDASAQLTHAVDIAAPPSAVWPWIAQAGFGRGGWYTPEWIDRWLWRVAAHNLDYVDKELQDVKVGDIIPDGPPGTAFFTVAAIDPERSMVLHSRRHPRHGREPDLSLPKPGPYVEFTWTFVLEAMGSGGSRLLLRTRGNAHAGWLGRCVGWLAWPPLDYLMGRWLLLGIRQRAEHFVHAEMATAGAEKS